nr:hypothetical protein [Akkermansiaceae bacterium]
DLKHLGATMPATGACALGSAMTLWLWTARFVQDAKDAHGAKLYSSNRHGISYPLADALCWLLASRQQVLDLAHLAEHGPADPALAEELAGTLPFLTDLCHVQAARAAGEVARICSDVVFGYNLHPEWTAQTCGCCYGSGDLDALEGIMPGIAAGARGHADIAEEGQAHPAKAGPCPTPDARTQSFIRLRSKLDGCLHGFGLAKDRAAQALTSVTIPEALDYPL